jgi:Zinc carboxypeptidase/Cytosolic carboxypeptidase N-terminal domain
MCRRQFTAFACFVLLLAMPRIAPAQLSLTGNFDHGSLLSWGGNLTTIQLTGRDNYYGDDEWRWMYFKASGVVGATPTFVINQNFAGDATPGPHELRDHEMVYSYDNENWFFFDNNHLYSTNTDDYRFWNSTPFTQDEVYVAYGIPYSYGKSVSHTQAVLASPWAEPTVSANSSGVIGQTPQRTDDIGRVIPPLDMFAYRITNPATDSPTEGKRKVGLTTGLHAGEPLGTHTFEGLIDWLISDDPRAARLRDVAEFFVYPTLNASGRYAGMNRTTVGNPNRDPNGLWDASRWSNSSFGCGGNNCQDIRETGEAMLADVYSTPGGGLDAFIDFHSTVPDYTGDGVYEPGDEFPPEDFGYIDIDGGEANVDWWLNFRALQPNVYQWQSGQGSFTTTGYARGELGADVDVTFETSFSWERNVDYYHKLGENFGIAFYQAWVPQVEGDYTGDGVVDASDYVLWRKTFGESGLGLMADGSGNGEVDQADYSIWREHFGMTAGSGAGAHTPQDAAVPEPASLAILVLAAALLAIVRPGVRPTN